MLVIALESKRIRLGSRVPSFVQKDALMVLGSNCEFFIWHVVAVSVTRRRTTEQFESYSCRVLGGERLVYANARY